MAITLLNGEERQKQVNEKLLEMKDVGKGIPVLFAVTEEGVKILKSDESSVKMAHGITKIAFSTCQPDKKLFAYIAKSHTSDGKILTQAHMFKTKKSHHTQELSSAISRAFKIAYAKNTTKRTNRVKLFEKEVQEKKVDVNVDRKRWAKSEMARGHENSGHALRALRYSQESSNEISADIKKLVEDIETTTSIHTLMEPVQQLQDPPPSEDQASECSDVFNEPAVSNHQVVENDNCVGKSLDISTTNSQQYKIRPGKCHPNLETKLSSSLQEGASESEFLEEESKLESPKEDIENNSDCAKDNKIRTSSECNNNNLEDWDIIPLSADFPHKLAIPVPRFGTLLEEESKVSKDKEKMVSTQETASMVLEEEIQFAEEVNEQNGKDQLNRKVNGEEKENTKMDINRITMSEKQILNDAEWYQLGFSRQIAESILQNRIVGSFFIRDSQSTPGCYVMTIKVPTSVKESGFMNYLIENLPDEYLRIKGFQSKFPSLLMLVAYYSSIDDELPCRLNLANSNPLFFTDHESNESKINDVSEKINRNIDQADFGEDVSGDDEDEDPDYINMCSNEMIMEELNTFRNELKA